MRNIRLILEYDGTNYSGWQVQNTRQPKKTIQAVIEKALRKVLREKVKLIASGRTDAGVHAVSQAANFKTAKNIPAPNLQMALNSTLPADIVITKVEEVEGDFHSRFSTRSKIYRYTILNHSYPSAFLRNTAYFCPHPLDIALMRKKAKCLLGRRDFSAFCASGSSAKSSIRTIKKISIKKINRLIIIDIEADGFLYNMARRIAGALIEVGRGRVKKLSGGFTAPARGLCLLKVNY